VIACWIGNCETSLHNHQKIPEYYAYEEAECGEQGQKQMSDQNKWHNSHNKNLVIHFFSADSNTWGKLPNQHKEDKGLLHARV
jgi:hypothetical protein